MTPEDHFLDCLASIEREGKHRECCWVFPSVYDQMESWLDRANSELSSERAIRLYVSLAEDRIKNDPTR